MDDTTCYNGPRCPGWNGTHAEPTHDPYCPACLDRAARDIRALVYDYLDLAQLHEASMSQAITEKTSGGDHDSPMLLAGHVEALQAEIVHVTTTWEYEVRVACQLPDPVVSAPIADWHTTISKPTPLAKVRPGAAVQRAVNILAAHLRRLAQLPTTAVCPTGVEDDPTDMTGAEAIEHLQQLHSRARGTLGRTRRTFWIPGECWTCNARPTPGADGPLYRSEPRDEGDDMQVSCSRCSAQRPYLDYETYLTTLLWPGQASDANVQVAA